MISKRNPNIFENKLGQSLVSSSSKCSKAHVLPVSNWTDVEQVQIFEEFKTSPLKWKTISRTVAGRSENSVKSFFYSSIRKIKGLKYLKFLKLMICFPTFRNNSNFHFYFSPLIVNINPRTKKPVSSARRAMQNGDDLPI